MLKISGNQIKVNRDISDTYFIQSTIDSKVQELSEKALLNGLSLFERKFTKWKKFSIDMDYPHWLIGKVSDFEENYILPINFFNILKGKRTHYRIYF